MGYREPIRRRPTAREQPDERVARPPAAGPAPSLTAVLALQRSIGNTATARLLSPARQRSIQRMPFARFQGLSPRTDWQYSGLEQELLNAEKQIAMQIAGLEPWARSSPRIHALTEQLEALRTTVIDERDYIPTLDRLRRLRNDIATARVESLNERGRELPGQPRFSNRLSHAIVEEVQEFLSGGGGSWEQYRDRAARTFRITIPVRPEQYVQGADESMLEALARSIQEHRQDFHDAIAIGSEVLWTYTEDGMLRIGDPASNKHSVIAAGSDVWAAGRAKLKISPARLAFLGWDDVRKKVASFTERLAEEKARVQPDREMIDVLESAIDAYEPTLAQLAPAAQDYDPALDAHGGPPTIVVDFDSGHYAPSKAWAKTHEAWEALGYRVEWNPSGRSA